MAEPKMTTSCAPSLTWHDGMLLGLEAMDVEHEELVELIEAVRHAPDSRIAEILDELAAHAGEHFRSEEALMTRTGFPAQACHAGEHGAVLRSIAGVQARVRGGNVQAARRLGAALAEWFPGHAEYLDASLAHWVCKQRHGGKPIVLRRRMPQVTAESATALPTHY